MTVALWSMLCTAPAQALEPGGPDKTMYDLFVTAGTGLEFGLPMRLLVSGFGVRGAWSERSTLSFDLRNVGSQSHYEAGDPNQDLAYAPWRSEVGVDFALTGSSAHGWQLGASAALQRLTVPDNTLLQAGIQTGYEVVAIPVALGLTVAGLGTLRAVLSANRGD